MNTLFMSLLLALGICASFQAQAADPVGDASAGQAKIAVCGACHGPDGNSLAPNFPKLAGQGERYLLKQLREIKDGTRVVVEMTGMLNNLTEQDLADISAYYARQKGSVGAASPDLVAQGEALFRGGRLAQGLPACTGCHSPDGTGNAQAGFPHLGGQHADYIRKQLTAFREGDRTNDGDTLVMRTIAAKLSTKDIEALAHYIQGLH
ncbi:c-type cytochrome [Pseudomonas viridiflava]|uniref:c-type cytochrome n=1 Tax=Pseudomonas viridiflava TaxID=33069 RepID=UPI000C080EB9|nr:c-type cytochrome [Pseudomonas viridiflava]MEE4342985.1 c-type cytochrome [Pseudomonas alliivorans]MEE5127391.1 c-type cytochrome [Pseudomonas alliivorans]MEE5164402.1 c-type cytochrome [Pseudomonas alliivorans]PHN55389.1 cytochrome C [Pseudomonas viridiflava]